MDREALKIDAKRQISGNILILLVISLIIAAITYIAGKLLSFIPIRETIEAIFPAGAAILSEIITSESIASFILGPACTISIIRVHMKLFYERRPEAWDAFWGFDDFWSAFKLNFLTGLFTFLWSLLFVIPGIIKSISYSMAPCILAENKGKPALECLRESKALTKGHKGELFVLGLSFLGWILLCVVTFGLASIWVDPYRKATFVNAYYSFKPQEEEAEQPIQAAQ